MPADQREDRNSEGEEWTIHSFIIKVWRDLPQTSGRRAGWRGRITHVPGSERRALKSLEEIADFIAPYLRDMGGRPQWRWRLWHWLCGSKRKHQAAETAAGPGGNDDRQHN